MINILVALTLLIIAIIQFEGSGQLLDQLWQCESFILVFLGTLTATVLQFPLRQLMMVGVGYWLHLADVCFKRILSWFVMCPISINYRCGFVSQYY